MHRADKVALGAFEIPLLVLPKKRMAKRIKKRNMSERSEFVSLPALPSVFSGTPRGSDCAVAFFCLLFLAKQEK
jgi:hypothetical protein